MARPERIQFPDACYHIMARGNAGGDIFFDDEDRSMFLDLLGEIATKAGWRIHAWCLMGNHFHLFLTTLHPNLSQFMQRFNGTYCQRFNRRHSRQGHVFQGRYKALLVSDEAYGLALLRYILRNPIEAGLVERADGYGWSSAGSVLKETRAEWMDFSLLEAQLSFEPKQTQDAKARALHEFVMQEARAPSALKGRIYGDEASIEKLGQVQFLPEDMTRPPIASFQQEGRPKWHAMACAVLEGKHRGADVARYFDVHRSTVTKAVARYEGL